MSPIVIGAQRILTPQGERAGRVVIEHGMITAVAGPDGPTDVDIPPGRVLLPGLVDTHVHVNEPGRTAWEGFATATAAAAAGGVTTIVDMPLNSIPATVDVESLRIKQRAAAGQLSIDVAFWGGAIPGNAGKLGALHDHGVVGFKCFLLPSGVPEFPHLDTAGVLEAMRVIAGFDGLLIAHAEDGALISEARGRSFTDFVATRPPAAERSAVQTLVDAARRTGCRTHVVHLSSVAALEVVRAARADGVAITAETCPHYLTLRAEDVPDGATQFKCCPPIRDAANQDALWAGLLDGTLDCVVSDHSPCTVADKRLDTGDFGQAWGGIASVQLGLPVVWTAARTRGIPLARVVDWMAAAPSRLARLPGRGTIAPGARADLCVFAPEEVFVVDAALLRHRNPLTPYAGRSLHGVVEQTWLAGEPVTDGTCNGRLVSRP